MSSEATRYRLRGKFFEKRSFRRSNRLVRLVRVDVDDGREEQADKGSNFPAIVSHRLDSTFKFAKAI